MRSFKKLTCELVACAVAVFLLFVAWSPDVAGVESWTNPVGSATDFDWINGGSTNGYFGSPTVVGNTFLFFPSEFRALSMDGVSDQITDQLRFQLIAHPNKAIVGFKITEYGDYEILGTGEVAVTGGLFLTRIDDLGFANDPLTVTDPAVPITSGSGIWTAEAEVSGIEWGVVQIQLDNTLSATTVGSGSIASVEKKVVSGPVIAIEVLIPEPGTFALVGFGLLALLRRR